MVQMFTTCSYMPCGGHYSPHVKHLGVYMAHMIYVCPYMAYGGHYTPSVNHLRGIYGRDVERGPLYGTRRPVDSMRKMFGVCT